jgi:ribA/ribD-fused uncharacterized protein
MMVFGKERDYIVHDDKVVKGFFGAYRFLSNFEVADVIYEGVKYPSSENAYQAAKSIDPTVRSQFLNITPAEAKKLGRKIEVRPDWDQVKYQAMYDIVLDKFKRNPYLAEMLEETGDRYLEETNHWRDTTWGVSYGVGTNWLGKILMDVRKIVTTNG